MRGDLILAADRIGLQGRQRRSRARLFLAGDGHCYARCSARSAVPARRNIRRDLTCSCGRWPSVSIAASRGSCIFEPSLLLGPRIWQHFREPCDGEIGRRVAVGDRRHDAWGDKSERRQEADMAFAKTFEIGDFGKSRDTTEVEVFNPFAGLPRWRQAGHRGSPDSWRASRRVRARSPSRQRSSELPRAA
jgi:hypothetical protein